MKKKIDLRMVAKTRKYTVPELAMILRVTKQAIYKKIHYKDLPCCQIDGVFYIYGEEFIEFEKQERFKRKPKKEPRKFWCMHCRKYRRPKGYNITVDDFSNSDKVVSEGTVLLKGICHSCNKNIYQLSNISQAEKYQKDFKVVDKL